jgi:hypothetical protein
VCIYREREGTCIIVYMDMFIYSTFVYICSIIINNIIINTYIYHYVERERIWQMMNPQSHQLSEAKSCLAYTDNTLKIKGMVKYSSHMFTHLLHIVEHIVIIMVKSLKYTESEQLNQRNLTRLALEFCGAFVEISSMLCSDFQGN